MAVPQRLTYCLCKFRWKVEKKSARNIVNCTRTTKALSFKRSLLHSHNKYATKASTNPDINPLKTLQPYMAVPIIPPEEVLFDPTVDEIEEGKKLFRKRHGHDIKFLKSALYTRQLPQYDLPEVAFVGRSNVGKSTLIRAILGEVADINVRISSKPGHTKTLNFYKVGEALSLVDMPGYGYHMPEHFRDSAEEFLKSRRNLKITYLLVDGKVGMTGLDRAFANKLSELGIKFCIVMTRIDKTRQSNLLKNFLSVVEYRKQATFCFYQPFLVSAFTREGIALLQTFVGYVTGNLKIQGL